MYLVASDFPILMIFRKVMRLEAKKTWSSITFGFPKASFQISAISQQSYSGN